MTKNSNIKAVIFDCDGVLVDSEPAWRDAQLRVLSDYGVHYDIDDYNKMFMGMMTEERMQHYDERHRKMNKDAPLPDDFYEKASRHYKENGKALIVFEQMRPLLETLSRKNISLAVGSNSYRESLVEKLEESDFKQYFGDNVVSSSDVKNSKPAPDIYQKAARLAGHNPADCIVVEDSLAGVDAAKAAGVQVMVIDHEKLHTDQYDKYEAKGVLGIFTEVEELQNAIFEALSV